MLADLYLQADSYVPALETIHRLLSLAGGAHAVASQRRRLESKAVACRLAQGVARPALAQCREVLRDEASIDSLPLRAACTCSGRGAVPALPLRGAHGGTPSARSRSPTLAATSACSPGA